MLDFGNLTQFEKHHPVDFELEMLSKHGTVYGIYSGVTPMLTVTRSEHIKQILVKDFHLFVNRRELNTWHQLVNLNQFFASDQDWKRIRTITSPTFSSRKLKKMAPLMNDCVEKLSVYLNGQIERENGIFLPKEVVTGFTIDVISTTAFASNTNANDSRDRENPVVNSGLRLFEGSPFRILSFLSFPRWFNNLVGIKYPFEANSFEYLTGMIREIIRQRKQSNVRREDFVQLLMDTFVYENELDSGFDKLTASADNG